VSLPRADELTTIELLVLYEAGGDNTLGNAYGVVQLYSVFEHEEDLNDATESALLRLFDLGLVRFVKTNHDVGYTGKRQELPALSREQLIACFHADIWGRDVAVWYDPTPAGHRGVGDSAEGPNPTGVRERPASQARIAAACASVEECP
jgi:hypothetical protein